MINSLGNIPDAILDAQRQQWLRGQQPDASQFLVGTEYQGDRESLLDLLYNEIVLKEELGFSPSVAEYVERYPELAEDLQLHFQVHQAINEQLLLETANTRAAKSWPGSSTNDTSTNIHLVDYEIEHFIGQGAMASVYQARHRRLHRRVAVKIFHSGRTFTSREQFRIRTEAEAMARLAHPNIVQIFEIGDERGTPFLALELVDGGTLALRLQQLPFDPKVAAELIEILARALQHAHERQIVHRDLKPANILFTKEGSPKLTDFGLAKVLEDRDVSTLDATQLGEAMGTPRYMSPEQASGRSDQISPATDVYALGTILYECLTGSAPFISSSVIETLQRIREENPLPLRRLQRKIPRDLETICLRCLEKEPSRRFASALDLADDLRRFQNAEPIHSRPTSNWEHAWKWCQKKPAQAAWVALGLLLCVGGLFAALIISEREKNRIDQLRQDVTQLMQVGRRALDQDELETAQARFQEAWIKIQSEPKLLDHATSITGWLDHTRNALNKSHWNQRVPPRNFDDRRDEALLFSLLPFPSLPDPIVKARDAIHSALELTIQDDSAWTAAREQLVVQESELILREAGAPEALKFLDRTYGEFDSRRFHRQRAALLRQTGRMDDADKALIESDKFPSQHTADLFQNGMNLLREGNAQQALIQFEEVLATEPGHFTARLFQAICFQRLQRFGEARVALTACVAQRPTFHACYFLRSQVHDAQQETELAQRDRASATAGKPSDLMRQIANIERGTPKDATSDASGNAWPANEDVDPSPITSLSDQEGGTE